MPRTNRVLLPHYAHHIVQQGHNRQVVFPECHDSRYYLNTLREWKTVYDIKVYAYCLDDQSCPSGARTLRGGGSIA